MEGQILSRVLAVMATNINVYIVHNWNRGRAKFVRLYPSAEDLKEVTCQLLKICLSHLTASAIF
jgi:hypothetical protein